jgi:hypothetical protein
MLSHESLRPERSFKKYWNLLVLLGICWYAITVPLFFALDIDAEGWTIVVDMAWTLFFMVDIYINFNTPYLLEGAWVKDKKIIRSRYLRSWFVMDLIATIPFDLLLMLLAVNHPLISSVTRLIRIFRVFRLFRLSDVVVNLSAHGKGRLVTDIVLDANANMKITLLIFWSIIGLNTISCGWLIISPQFMVGDPFKDYVMGAYWAVTTLTTVGYGDISPVGEAARLYTMLVMMVGVIIYGLIIGNISNVMQQEKAHKTEQREKVVELAHFLKNYQIPMRLQEDIFNYYNHYVFEKNQKQSKIMDELPVELQAEVNDFVKVHMLRDVPLFKNASQECLTDMVRCFKSKTLSPHEEIIRFGEVGDEMFFISHGVVDILTKDNLSVAKLRSGSFFGEVALIESVPRTATVRTVTFTDILVLKKPDFMRVMKTDKDFRLDVEKIMKERYT